MQDHLRKLQLPRAYSVDIFPKKFALKMKTRMAILLLFLSGPGHPACAQNCPAGIPSAGNPLCIPPDRENSPYYQGPNSYSKPQVIWADRWGAIATDGMRASTGAAVGMRKKMQAEKAALAQCRSNGGENCKLILAYYNQCAVVVTGDRQHLAQGAVTEGEASQLAIQKCNQIDANCRVYYSDCSLPERVR